MSPLSDLGQVRRLDGACLAPSWRLGHREDNEQRQMQVSGLD